jgi:PPM family protein phosphatase
MVGHVTTGYAQLIGERGEQQDAYGISDAQDIDFVQHGGVLAVVADGIGGHAHGADASALAVEEFMRAYQCKFRRAKIPETLYAALKKTNAAVCEFAELQGEEHNCGTTLVAAVVHPKARALYWVSVGDSRLYLLRGTEWVQLTADGNYTHRWAKKLARGTLSEEDEQKLATHSEAITSFLGSKHPADIDRSLRPFRLHPGDWVVLCTDGLFNALTEEEIRGCLQGDPQAACETLVQAVVAKAYKTQDNCTVVALGYRLPKPPRAAPETPPSPADPPPAKSRPVGWWPWLRVILIVLAVLLLVG